MNEDQRERLQKLLDELSELVADAAAALADGQLAVDEVAELAGDLLVVAASVAALVRGDSEARRARRRARRAARAARRDG